MDFLYIGIVVVFFGLTWALMKLCDHLREHKSGERS